MTRRIADHTQLQGTGVHQGVQTTVYSCRRDTGAAAPHSEMAAAPSVA
eukprot:CAMPEP_0181237882 /NCGR_PEP_ID=MMETSP1096-20121128/39017_1 /TAXON_ID=156174 ORGANISM="Chrysochromulina ericina, Strain CCMP281" /NCGR_SAMPLE_ID=MMETSP1096 /ASSEMBLY_ACC=CAM_ASM_000453 /LENGTH=47 /DNA_ID= /DNA_START= /DNA_END= /DNA_ORIENTATION=